MPYTNAEINVFAAEADISVTTVTEKPANPVISLQSTASGDGVKVVIGKTKDADGYRIYMKAPGQSKYKKIKSLSISGEAKRSYACESRIVKPSDYYRINTNNKAGSYGKYWLVNETAGTMITVDGSGKISSGAYSCNVYEVGVVPVIKVDLIHCNVFDK